MNGSSTTGATPSRYEGIAAGAIVLALFAPPLAGLIATAIDPPPSGFQTTAPSIGELIAGSQALVLTGRTLALGLIVCLLSLPIGTWLAWLEQRASYRGARTLAWLGLLPLAVPSYILAAAVRNSLSPAGLFGPAVRGALGDIMPFGPVTGMPPAILVMTLITIPYVQLVVGSALCRTSAAEEEAARSLGGSPWRVFRTVTLQPLRPALAFAMLLTVLYVVSDFGAVAVLDCQVLTWRLFQAVNTQQLGVASWLGIALMTATVPLLLLARWLHGAGSAGANVANPRPCARRRLGVPGLIAAYSTHLFVVGLGLLLPLGVMFGWVFDGWRQGLYFVSPWAPLRDTAMLMIVGATITVALALLPAWSAGRNPGRPTARALESLVYLTGALPGVLVAFGLIAASLALTRLLEDGGQLYNWTLGTGVLLLMGYAVRYLGEAYGPLKTSVMKLDPRWEESIRVLRAPRQRWLLEIAAPTLAPGAAAGFALLTLALVKELPLTLILGAATGLRPLSFRTFDRYQEAFLHDAGLAGLGLVALAVLAVIPTLRWRRHAS